MAKSKAKNLKKKKKVSTYDDKLIKIIAASVVGVSDVRRLYMSLFLITTAMCVK